MTDTAELVKQAPIEVAGSNAGNLIRRLKSRIKKLLGKLSSRRKQLEQTQSTVQTAHDGAEAIEDASSSTDEIEKVVKVGAETTEIAASIPIPQTEPLTPVNQALVSAKAPLGAVSATLKSIATAVAPFGTVAGVSLPLLSLLVNRLKPLEDCLAMQIQLLERLEKMDQSKKVLEALSRVETVIDDLEHQWDAAMAPIDPVLNQLSKLDVMALFHEPIHEIHEFLHTINKTMAPVFTFVDHIKKPVEKMYSTYRKYKKLVLGKIEAQFKALMKKIHIDIDGLRNLIAHKLTGALQPVLEKVTAIEKQVTSQLHLPFDPAKIQRQIKQIESEFESIADQLVESCSDVSKKINSLL